VSYTTVLQAYTLTELLELNDKTEEDCLEFLVEEGFITLPEVLPLDYD
jgi:hypothetical protein